ncbi:MAG: hypothetical protein COU06_02850 [Candidatus Harrisonbacteria bacterium CG10_big_fil_rev_8_21_14_0_10_38_8]|uniref:DUF5667 domain-containing protein n=1 Tax=Candidatus Harrisonbacteria bacterium CG10_big_fil_rev_8_21_14_0_10_38_8 TaxID=1974582 RepID=A0A2M6WJB2_9BACT|nr:MAG: hypothetical protein COU06_02850 [Candidatus Harrisonbacteria bacterium CG10_big_fil_rev_8_21_14_0_10_38_8]
MTKKLGSIILSLTIILSSSVAYGSEPKILAQSEELNKLRTEVVETATMPEKEVSKEEELAQKKEALIKVFDFSIQELKELSSKEKLISLIKGEKIYNLEARSVLDKFTEFEKTISEYKEMIQDKEVTLELVQQTAISFKEWRESIYDPEVAIAFDILLVAKGDGVLEKTNERFTKIEKDLQKLSDLKRISKEDYQQNLQLAKNSLQISMEFQNKIEGLLEAKILASQPVIEDSLALSATTTEEVTMMTMTATSTEEFASTTATLEVIEEEKPEEIKNILIEQFNSIKDTYQEFFKISKIVKEVVRR